MPIDANFFYQRYITNRQPPLLPVLQHWYKYMSGPGEQNQQVQLELVNNQVRTRVLTYNNDAPAHARHRPSAEFFKKYHHRGTDGHNAYKQYQIDTAMWYGTLVQNAPFPNLGPRNRRGNAPCTNENQQIIDFLKRLFLTIRNGGLFVKRDNNEWQPWHNHNGGDTPPLASVLSHGGRVLIQLPPGDNHMFLKWLFTGNRHAPNITLAGHNLDYYRRAGATHAVQRWNKSVDLGHTRRKHITERKLTFHTGQKMHDMQHFGVDIPLGGNGNVNPFSDQLIYANGEHGHLYLGYRPAEQNKYGGILLGCEDSAPIDKWNPIAWQREKNDLINIGGGFKKGGIKYEPEPQGITRNVEVNGFPYRETHLGWCRGQTGHAHKLGGAGKFSVTGGKKWKERDWSGGAGPKSSNNAMFLDLGHPGPARTFYFALMGMNAGDFNPASLGDDVNDLP